MREQAEKRSTEDEQLERTEKEGIKSRELVDRPDYESAMSTLRRFDRMIDGTEEPVRIVRENTRGTWTRSRLTASERSGR